MGKEQCYDACQKLLEEMENDVYIRNIQMSHMCYNNLKKKFIELKNN